MNHLFQRGTVVLCAALACCLAEAKEPERTVNEGGIKDQWMMADGVKLAAPGYPAAFAARGENVCAAISYRINPDGTTSDFSLVRAWSSSGGNRKEPEEGFWKAFSEASALALAQWKFKPRPEVTRPVPTMTVATMTFMGKQAEDVTLLRSRCKVDNLTATLKELNKYPRRNDLDSVQLDANQRAQRANEIRANQQARGNSSRTP